MMATACGIEAKLRRPGRRVMATQFSAMLLVIFACRFFSHSERTAVKRPESMQSRSHCGRGAVSATGCNALRRGIRRFPAGALTP